MEGRPATCPGYPVSKYARTWKCSRDPSPPDGTRAGAHPPTQTPAPSTGLRSTILLPVARALCCDIACGAEFQGIFDLINNRGEPIPDQHPMRLESKTKSKTVKLKGAPRPEEGSAPVPAREASCVAELGDGQ